MTGSYRPAGGPGSNRGNSTNASRAPAYGRMPTAPIAGGAIATMKRGEISVYVVICAHSGADWTSYPSIPRIAREAGLSERQVYRVLSKLVERALITIDSGGGRRRTNTYRLNPNPDTHHVMVLPEKAGQQDVRVSDKNGDTSAPKPCHPGSETVTNRARNGDPLDVTRNSINSREQQQQAADQSPGRAAAAAEGAAEGPPPDAEVLRRLMAAGISEPTRTRLARSGLLALDVARCVDRWQHNGKGIGALVNDLRAAAEATIAKAEQQRRRSEQEAVREAKRRAERDGGAIERPPQEWIEAEARRQGFCRKSEPTNGAGP